MSDFAPCVAFTLREEGGFVDNPDDPGNATNLGITLATLSHWRGHSCTVDDVRALTQAEASAIYRADYWTPLMADSVASGLDLMLFDFGVNTGCGASTRMLQRIIGVTQDGEMGPETLHAAVGSLAVIRSRIASLGSLQEQYYRDLPTFDEFGSGWIARTQRRQSAAMALTIHVPPIAEPSTDNVGASS